MGEKEVVEFVEPNLEEIYWVDAKKLRRFDLIVYSHLQWKTLLNLHMSHEVGTREVIGIGLWFV